MKDLEAEEREQRDDRKRERYYRHRYAKFEKERVGLVRSEVRGPTPPSLFPRLVLGCINADLCK